MKQSFNIALVAAVGTGVAVVASSCAFEPEIADGAFACASDRTCPTGFVSASDGRCRKPGSAPIGGDGGVDPDGGSSSGPDGPFVIGGQVSGLAGKGLVLQDVGTDDLPIEQNGPFSFGTKLPAGALYNVTVSSQPSEPSQTCTVAKPSGVVAADVRDVAVTCETASYVVGGTVLGNVGTGLVLSNNASDDLPVSAIGAFAFAKKVPSGSPYAVIVKTQPTGGGPCDVSGGTGTMGVTDVKSVVVNCLPGTYTVGGTVSGLVGSVVVTLNGADLTLTANGSFAFPQSITAPASYDVTVKTQPAYPPRAQDCVVTNGSGNITTANITNVTVTCTTKTFTVGGNVTNLNGTVQLTNNGADQIDVTATGPVSFPKKIGSGSTYAVAVKTQPVAQTCTVSNGNGTVENAAIANVAVSCQARDPGILCSATHCDPSTTVCCPNGISTGQSSPQCVLTSKSCNGSRFACDSTGDCAGTPGTICCGQRNPQGVLTSTSCTPFASCSGNVFVLCDPKIPTECANGGTCTPKALDEQGNDPWVRDNYAACK